MCYNIPMESFKQYIYEGNKGLTIFDIDDTMFKTKAKVLVRNKNTGKVRKLSPQEYNNYKLQKDEEWDYREFKSAKVFFKTATPIARMVEKAKAIIKNATAKGSKVIIVTARADMDNRDLFIKTFEAHGIPMKNVYVERAGNMSNKYGAAAKQVIFKKYLETGEYARVRLFDDHYPNLKALLDLQRDYPNVDFQAYLADKTGSVKRYRD